MLFSENVVLPLVSTPVDDEDRVVLRKYLGTSNEHAWRKNLKTAWTRLSKAKDLPGLCAACEAIVEEKLLEISAVVPEPMGPGAPPKTSAWAIVRANAPALMSGLMLQRDRVDALLQILDSAPKEKPEAWPAYVAKIRPVTERITAFLDAAIAAADEGN